MARLLSHGQRTAQTRIALFCSRGRFFETWRLDAHTKRPLNSEVTAPSDIWTSLDVPSNGRAITAISLAYRAADHERCRCPRLNSSTFVASSLRPEAREAVR